MEVAGVEWYTAGGALAFPLAEEMRKAVRMGANGTPAAVIPIEEIEVLSYSLKFVAVGLIAVLSFAAHAFGQEDAKQQHPFLYFTADELPALREKLKTEPFAERFERLLSNADRLLERDPASDARNSLGAAGLLSFAYVITEDERYARKAKEQVDAMLDLELWHQPDRDWNKGADLGTAERSVGVALFYDWCYDTLSEEERQHVATRLMELGVAPYLASVEVHNDWWVNNPVSNWCGVCHGGGGLAGLVLADEFPEARRAADHAREHLIDFLDHVVGDDGAGHEGVMYWRYGAEFSLYYLTAAQHAQPGPDVERALASASEKLPGYWFAAMQAPDGKFANFNNMNESTYEGLYGEDPRNREGGPNAPLSALFERWAAKGEGQGDPLLLWAADNGGSPFYFDGTSPFWFIWRREAAPAGEKPELPDAMLFRTAGHTIWKNDDLWLAYNAGWISDKSHNNRDLGSFVLVYDGERFVADPGYGHSEAAQHSTIVIDGGDQVRGKGARYLGWTEGDGFKYLISELSEVYQQPLDRFERQLVLVGDRTLVIVDTLIAPKAHTFQWRLQSRLEPTVNNGTAAIAGERSTLHVVSALPESAKVSIGKEEINYIAINPDGPSNEATFVTVLHFTPTGESAPEVSLDRRGARVTLRIEGDEEATLEFNAGRVWRLSSVNGEDVGRVTRPTQRTFTRVNE